MCRKELLAAQASLFLMVLAASGAAGDEEADADAGEEIEAIDRTPIDCIQTNRIRQTKVIDGRTILFEMGGGDYFTNVFERDCPTLEREGRFMHETNGRLCSIDTITVLEQWGATLSRGFTCQLGLFYPITEIEADALIRGPDEVAPEVEVREVILPPGEEPAPAPEEAAED